MTKRKSNKISFTNARIEAIKKPEKGCRIIIGDSNTPYLFIRVTPSNRTFFWQRTIKGKRHIITIDQYPTINVKQARKAVENINADYSNGTNVQAERLAERNELTVGELWEDYKLNRESGTGTVTAHQLWIWNRHLSKWADRKMSEISHTIARDLITEFRKPTSKKPSGRGPTGNSVHTTGKAMWNHAINDMGWVGVNPFLFKKATSKGTERNNLRLRQGDMPQFFEALEKVSPAMRLIFLSSLFTGRRIGEAMAMRWADLDLEASLWHVTGAGSATGVKTGAASQLCVLPPVLKDELVKYRNQQLEKNSMKEWVFVGNGPDGHITSVFYAWTVIKKHGFSHLQPRDLRGTMASWMQEIGMPIAGAAQQLGHGNIETTFTNYTSISGDVQRDYVDKAVRAMLLAAKRTNNVTED